jgi:hypothetical protein
LFNKKDWEETYIREYFNEIVAKREQERERERERNGYSMNDK